MHMTIMFWMYKVGKRRMIYQILVYHSDRNLGMTGCPNHTSSGMGWKAFNDLPTG